jgi:hypothetical protein
MECFPLDPSMVESGAHTSAKVPSAFDEPLPRHRPARALRTVDTPHHGATPREVQKTGDISLLGNLALTGI